MKENTAMEQVGSGADRLDSFFTRRGFVKVSGAFVAGMVALGLLPDSAAAAPTSSKGEVYYTRPRPTCSRSTVLAAPVASAAR